MDFRSQSCIAVADVVWLDVESLEGYQWQGNCMIINNMLKGWIWEDKV